MVKSLQEMVMTFFSDTMVEEGRVVTESHKDYYYDDKSQSGYCKFNVHVFPAITSYSHNYIYNTNAKVVHSLIRLGAKSMDKITLYVTTVYNVLYTYMTTVE